jgi:iron complex transport system ATP-binding protein
MSAVLLATRGLAVEIGGKQVCAGLDAEFRAGECIGVLGPNGVGKTTLLHTLAGLRAPAAGALELAGAPLASLGRREVAQRVALLMQQQEDPFPTTVLETALIGRHPHIGFWRWESDADVARAGAALGEVGLTELAGREVQTLSGGERRRLAAATVLVQDPPVFLLDEPTDQLDPFHERALLERFRGLATRSQRLVMMTLHDVNHAVRCCDRVLLLFGAGQHLLAPTAVALTPENLERLYGVRMATVERGGRRWFIPE